MNANFKINGAVIETNRLLLRAFTQADLYDFNEYASVAGVGEMAGWNHHENIEESQRVLDNFIKNYNLCAKEKKVFDFSENSLYQKPFLF